MIGRLGKEVLHVGLPAASCFALAALATRGLASELSDLAALAVGLILYAATVAVFMPTHRSLVIRFTQSIRGSALAVRPDSSHAVR